MQIQDAAKIFLQSRFGPHIVTVVPVQAVPLAASFGALMEFRQLLGGTTTPSHHRHFVESPWILGIVSM